MDGTPKFVFVDHQQVVSHHVYASDFWSAGGEREIYFQVRQINIHIISLISITGKT